MKKDNGVLGEARRLYALGFAIIWLHPREKRPIGDGWTTGPKKSWEKLEREYRPGVNMGVRLGTPSKLKDGYLAAIDIDIKSKDKRHQREALEAAERLVAEADYPRVRSGRGFGSRHLYARTAQPQPPQKLASSSDLVKVFMPSVKVPSKRDRAMLTPAEVKAGYRIRPAWEIGIMGEGQQVVLPPSIHPDSGGEYRWKRPVTSSLPKLGINGAQLKASTASNETSQPKLEPLSPVKLEGFTPVKVDLEILPTLPPDVLKAIQNGDGVTDRSGYLLRAATALFSEGLSTNEVLSVLTDRGNFLGASSFEHAQTKSRYRAAQWVYRYTVKKIELERDASSVFGNAGEVEKPRKLTQKEMDDEARAYEEGRSWKEDLSKTKFGNVAITLRNLDLILTNSVEPGGVLFVEDLFASRVHYGADTPWGGKANEYVQDIDMVLIKRHLADTVFKIEPNTAALHEVTQLLGHRCRKHPVREWLNSLKWDGVNRVDTWLKDYCFAKAEEPFLSEASRLFLLAMVKRIFEPGCQWDYTLILEGKQGQYKSSIARALASDKWFMDNIPDLKDKDSMLNLQGKWLVELGELADVKRADYNQVKQYLVRRVDTVRPHYGRLKADVPRQSVFIGTINEGQYLKDPTGNRRYWPVKVGLCNLQGLLEVRDQLFAEAMHIYRSQNPVLVLTETGKEQAEKAQEDRRVDDDESEMREALLHFMDTPEGKVFNFDRFKTRDLMQGPNAPWGMWGDAKRGNQLNTAAHVLHTLGFEKRPSDGQRFWRKTSENRRSIGGVASVKGDATVLRDDDF